MNTNLIFFQEDFSLSYDDFTPSWYQSKGTSLIIGAYMRATIPFWEMVYTYWKPIVLQFWDRKLSNDLTRTRQNNTEKYLKVYKNTNFSVERSYSEIMTIIFFTSFYYNTLPHVVVPGIINLILIYYKDKILSKKFYLT